MARIITKELAVKIVKKLNAPKEKVRVDQIASGAHVDFAIFHEEVLIAHTSIRHGSNQDQGHDHMPHDLGVGPSFAKRFGQCSKSVKQIVKEWRDDGRIS